VTTLEEQYAAPDNLRARIALHERFSTNPYPYPRWVFDGYDFAADAEILEVGCGDGMIWRETVDRIPDGWRLTLTDQSQGMVQAAEEVLGPRAAYAVARVEELPFRDESYDAVIANHMLFHVEDRSRALSEIRRVLRPGGGLTATTVGRAHLRELRELAPPDPDGQFARTRERFTAETAPEEVAPYLADVSVEWYPGELRVTDADAVVAFVRSRGGETEERLDLVRKHVAGAIARDGVYRVTVATARVRCRKP
jgi:SAM-dependent methyltransferase